MYFHSLPERFGSHSRCVRCVFVALPVLLWLLAQVRRLRETQGQQGQVRGGKLYEINCHQLTILNTNTIWSIWNIYVYECVFLKSIVRRVRMVLKCPLEIRNNCLTKVSAKCMANWCIPNNPISLLTLIFSIAFILLFLKYSTLHLIERRTRQHARSSFDSRFSILIPNSCRSETVQRLAAVERHATFHYAIDLKWSWNTKWITNVCGVMR